MTLRPIRPLLGLVLVLLVFATAACGGGAGEAGDTAAEPAPSETPSPAPDVAESEPDPTESEPEPTESEPDQPVAGSEPASGFGDREATIAALKEGGMVVYIRHSVTEAVTEDPETIDLDDPSTQRNLSEAGRAQAVTIGEAFRALDIPIGTLYSSPYERALETARLAFPDITPTVRDDLTYPEYPGADLQELVATVRELVTTPPPAGENTVIVGHGMNLEGATFTSIEQGAGAVFAPTGEGSEPQLVDVIPAAGWAELATAGTP